MGNFISKKNISLTAFTFAVFLFLTIAAFYLYNIFSWANYPDFGFNVRFVTGSLVVADVSENGSKAGLKLGDRISSINGIQIQSFEALRAHVNRALGKENIYLILRDGQQHQVAITNVALGYKKAFGKSGLTFFLGLCYFLIGVIIFLMKPHHKTSWIYLATSSAFGIYLMFLRPVGVTTPSWLESSTIIAYTFIPAFLIHLAFSFPEKRRILDKNPRLPALLYIISAILFLSIMSVSHHMSDIPPLLYTIAVLYIAISVFWFLGSCVQLWWTSPSQIVKVRSKMILIGFAVSFAAPLVDLIFAVVYHRYITTNPNYYLPFFVFFPLFLGYSIVKHDLFDFDLIIKRTYGYILTTGCIAGFYGLFVLISDLLFGGFEIAKSPVFPLIFILAVVFLFNPMRNRVQQVINRVFYRLEYDYRETVQNISESMRSLLKLDDIAKSIMDTALGVMFIDSGCVVLLDQNKQHCQCILREGERENLQHHNDARSNLLTNTANDVAERKTSDEVEDQPKMEKDRAVSLSDLELPFDNPLIQKLSERKKEVTIYDIQEDPLFENDRESCMQAFNQLEATLIVPMIYEDRLSGFISLGEKKSGKFYQQEDIHLLNTLANQGVVAIENALLLEEMIEKERIEEELAIAHDLQTSMLPASVPELKGIDIAAFSASAREVGGDFYDFIEMRGEKLGIVVGDVTGKSVSGALVMSASRSVFRMLSEEALGVAESMNRANLRVKKDIKSGMFVALLYAVLNAEDRSLRICSAGQTQPIFLPSDTRDADFIETEGDTFPLGLLEEARYEEKLLHFSPGDKIIFYTDGIVEAMNEHNEMFGFERLQEVVVKSRSLSADALMRNITDSVNEFVAGAAQHDDLTVIVICATES